MTIFKISAKILAGLPSSLFLWKVYDTLKKTQVKEYVLF